MQVSKRRLLGITLITVIASILLTSSFFYAQASILSNTLFVEEGIYPGAPSYTVWRFGSTYYCKDINGDLIYSGTNLVVNILQYLVTSKCSIEFTEGTFIWQNALNITNSVSIVGAGSNLTILQLGTDVTMFNVTERYFEIEKCWLDGNYKTGNAIFLSGYSDTLNARISRNRIQHFKGYAIWLSGEPADIWIVENRIIENDRGVLISGASDNWIIGNEIGAIVERPGLELASSAHNNVYGNMIYMAGYNYTSGAWNSARAGISIYQSSYETLTANRLTTNGGEGILIYNSTYCQVTGSYISYNDNATDNRAGIALLGNSTWNNIVGITFWNWQDTQNYGVLENDTANWNTVSSCNAWNMTTKGFEMSGANSTIHNCYNGTEWIS